MRCGGSESGVIRSVITYRTPDPQAMLPRLRLVVASLAAVLALIGAALGVLSGARTSSVFAIGLRSAQGSPIERALPEPPDWKQLVALAASRRADELNRLLELPASAPAAEAPTVVIPTERSESRDPGIPAVEEWTE